jgi:transcriptional regulator with XRE-family HTH domain
MVFGRYLAIRRKRAALSLRAVARALSIQPSYLDQVERGARPPFGEERWDALITAVPGVTWEGLLWAAVATTDAMPVGGLTRLQRLAVAELVAVLRESDDLPERFHPEEASDDHLARLDDPGRPTAIAGLEEIIGDGESQVANLADTIVALGWRPHASNPTAAVSHLLVSNPNRFVRKGKKFRVRRR